MKIPMIGLLPQSFLAYWELISQGAIMSSAKDEDVEVILKGYLTGDVQVRIHHRKGTLLSSTNLQGVGETAIAEFRSKFISLKVLPIFLIFLFNSGGLYAYYHYIYQQIKIHIPLIDTGSLNKDLPHLLILIVPVLSVVFSRSIGSLILKIGIGVVFWVIKLYELISSKKKSQS